MASLLLLAALSGPGAPGVLTCGCDALDPNCIDRVAPGVLTCNCDPLDPGCDSRVVPGVLTPEPDPMFAVAAR